MFLLLFSYVYDLETCSLLIFSYLLFSSSISPYFLSKTWNACFLWFAALVVLLVVLTLLQFMSLCMVSLVLYYAHASYFYCFSLQVCIHVFLCNIFPSPLSITIAILLFYICKFTQHFMRRRSSISLKYHSSQLLKMLHAILWCMNDKTTFFLSFYHWSMLNLPASPHRLLMEPLNRTGCGYFIINEILGVFFFLIKGFTGERVKVLQFLIMVLFFSVLIF